MTVMDEQVEKLTPKGRAARQRIVEAAAKLIYERGVHATNNELVRAAAGVSGSQLSHYFPDKESLIRAVIEWRAGSMMGLHDDPPRGELDSWEALRAWADAYLQRTDIIDGGCSFGSLASEVMKTDLAVHDAIAAGFDRWREVFVRGLSSMRERGELRPDAEPQRLAYVLAAAFQGGLLLTQGAHDVEPLRAALDGALDYVATFAHEAGP
jgi:TetR/AcrR family transcriptional regulator, transcriptional repressor for nem operon